MCSTSDQEIVPARAGPVRGVGPRAYLTLTLGISLLLGMPGCGQSPPPSESGRASEALLRTNPRWRIKKGGAGAAGLTLQAHAPMRVRVRMQSEGTGSKTGPWRTLVSGETVEVLWSFGKAPEGSIKDRPTPEDAALGRTAPLAVQVSAHFADRRADSRRLTFWARPGMGRVLHADALPPGRYEDLPTGGRLELQTIAFLDYAAGGGHLKRREQDMRLLVPESQRPGDRYDVVRLFLDYTPVGP